MDPRVAFDVYQRLPHLPMRMREHGARAMAVARRLEELGVDTRYPGLASHPQHDLFTSMLNEGYGSGGMLTVDCGSRRLAGRLMDALQNDEGFGYIAVSLGYSDTLLSCSGSSTSSEIPAEEQAAMGLSPGLMRMAVGYTGAISDRLEQVERAARKVGLTRSPR
jgi:methionine-gamma-lyase